jgi:Zn-dependent protease
MIVFDVILLLAFAVCPAIVLHECAHALAAYWLGDNTAKNQGRLTLNPIKHIDPVGSIIVPGILFLLKSPFFFGWAKPVPVNFSNLKNLRLGIILVAIAGPLSNVLLAWVYIQIFKFDLFPSLSYVWQWAILFNIVICVFNLIPIPPLDGSRVVTGLLPRELGYQYNRLEPIGMIIVLVLLQLGLLKFLYPSMSLLGNWLGVQL